MYRGLLLSCQRRPGNAVDSLSRLDPINDSMTATIKNRTTLITIVISYTSIVTIFLIIP